MHRLLMYRSERAQLQLDNHKELNCTSVSEIKVLRQQKAIFLCAMTSSLLSDRGTGGFIGLVCRSPMGTTFSAMCPSRLSSSFQMIMGTAMAVM